MEQPYPASPFSCFAKWTARAAGHPIVFLTAVLTILGWAITGPFFGFGDTWQLVINTGTTIVTFLMVFLIQNTQNRIQNTQNRDSAVVQLKLDELIRAAAGAHNALLDLEELTEQDFDLLRAQYQALARGAREDLKRGLADTGTCDTQAA